MHRDLKVEFEIIFSQKTYYWIKIIILKFVILVGLLRVSTKKEKYFVGLINIWLHR